MSQPLSIPPISCNMCGRSVPYTLVQSNANGNKGRWLAKCLQKDPATGTMCKFWHWLPGSRSPSLSPRLVSSQPMSAVHPGGPAPPVFLSTPGAGGLLNTSAVPHKASCLALGCNSTRIRRDCGRRMCKAHCLEAGGCQDPAHKKVQPMGFISEIAPPPAAVSLPSLSLPTQPILGLSSHPYLATIPPISNSHVGAGPSVSSSSSNLVLSRAEPTFSSHISPVFTSQMAREEQLREANRQLEATRLQSKKKVQQTVFIYAWMEDGVSPSSFEIQEGFLWPHFILNKAVLSLAGFPVSPDLCFNLFRFNLCLWTMVRVDHVVELKDNPRIFIKATHVRHCQDFTQLLASTSSSALPPNIRTNLAGERAFIKRKMVAHELSQAPKSSITKNKRSSNDLFSTPKRQRILSDSESVLSDEFPSPTVTVMKYRPPVPRPAFKRGRGAATMVVRRKLSAAAREREQMECYDSDSGLEFTDPFPFHDQSPVPSTSRSSAAPTLSISSLHVGPEEALPFLLPPDLPSKKLKWPVHFFAVDIVKCFDAIEDGAAEAKVKLTFECHFGQWVGYKKSTYYEHRQRWEYASLEVKEAVLSAGRTEAGCWSQLMVTTPAFRAELKAARKRQSKQTSVSVIHDIIEVSSASDDEA